MTALLASEIRRLASRRLVWIALLVSTALVLVLLGIRLGSSNADRFGEAMRPSELWLTRGMAFELGVGRDNIIATIAVLTYLLVVVIGASAVGAEYRAGTVTTVLTWEPRRVRLLVGRFVAIALVAMAFFLVIHVVLVGGWTLGALVNGTTEETDADFWRELGSVVARSTAIAGGLAVLSGAVATLGRNTAAALGVWFGYLIVVEGIVRANFSELTPWFLTVNIASFFGWETLRAEGETISPGAGALRLLLYLVVIGAGAVAVFRSRDVT